MELHVFINVSICVFVPKPVKNASHNYDATPPFENIHSVYVQADNFFMIKLCAVLFITYFSLKVNIVFWNLSNPQSNLFTHKRFVVGFRFLCQYQYCRGP